eukprot:CAMPEP_0115872796 /NCGR_PEP_ID=MMETSP0287-20121206/23626_1 /TAXON_ID=412157 /ORGANISM="Chrysochromulina rotalis, Strain UIO044" /LENGTH=84 /DNA_ID=CAMNT_0003327759 /DNA_START=116 /DNA_END=368 /DNA_ORIENTATION=+
MSEFASSRAAAVLKCVTAIGPPRLRLGSHPQAQLLVVRCAVTRPHCRMRLRAVHRGMVAFPHAGGHGPLDKLMPKLEEGQPLIH